MSPRVCGVYIIVAKWLEVAGSGILWNTTRLTFPVVFCVFCGRRNFSKFLQVSPSFSMAASFSKILQEFQRYAVCVALRRTDILGELERPVMDGGDGGDGGLGGNPRRGTVYTDARWGTMGAYCARRFSMILHPPPRFSMILHIIPK